jgi:putative ABC transport system permease protein
MTPLAWLQVTRDKTRLLVAISGVAFACVLIFMQLGFLDALFEGATRPHRCLAADLVLVNPKQRTFFTPKSFPRNRLYQALGYEGVDSVAELMMGTLQWRNPLSGQIRSILVFGVNPARHVFDLPGVAANRQQLKLLNRVLFDRASRPEFGPIAELLARSRQIEVELNGRRVMVSGLFEIGASFAADGTVITSDTTFASLFNRKSCDEIEVGLVKLKPGASLGAVREALAGAFRGEVAVYTLDQFAEVEKSYWATATGIGFIFGLGVAVGFVVGVVIVYQILYADVADHLSEYATLKAIGYTDDHLLSVFFQEAFILAVLGYVPGFILTACVYLVAEQATFLPIHMSWGRAVFVFGLAVAMCSSSAAIAMRKLRTVDPADVF